MNQRGQAAVEFLTTYGFAFFALLVTLGVISYAGIFNFSDLQSDECSFPSGLVCMDYVLNEADPAPELPAQVNALGAGSEPYARLILLNGYGVNITVTEAVLTMKQFSGVQGCGIAPAADPDWPAGENRTFWCLVPADAYIETQRYEGVFSLNFTQEGGTYVHSVKGSLSLHAQ